MDHSSIDAVDVTFAAAPSNADWTDEHLPALEPVSERLILSTVT
ncbi:hypothetical protein [Natrinema sp. CBA1119]|nr:hypothetical protein [Natrinema sp. CBA1119]